MKINQIAAKLAVLLAGSASAQTTCSRNNTQFLDVSSLLGPFTVGVEDDRANRGITWLDYNNDGKLDILIPNSGVAGLFMNLGDGTFSENLASAAGLDAATFTIQAVVGDLNNDGFVDIVFVPQVVSEDPVEALNTFLVYKNNGDGTFTDVSKDSGLGSGSGWHSGGTLGDFNNDGLLDFFIGGRGTSILTPPRRTRFYSNKLYRNIGNFVFEDVTEQAGVTGLVPLGPDGTDIHGQSCVSSFHDYNGDRHPDILVGNCLGEPSPAFDFYRNNQDGTFTNVTAEVGFNALGIWMGMSIGDVDGDGDFDIYTGSTGGGPFPIPAPSNPDGIYPHILWINNGDGTYTAEANGRIPNHEFNWGSTLFDADNDGDLDLASVGSLAPRFFGAVGPGVANPGRFFVNSNTTGADFDGSTCVSDLNMEDSFTTGMAQGDFDGDGYQDLLVMAASFNATSPVPENENSITHAILLKNKGGSNKFLTVKLIGTESNRDGIGAVVEVNGMLREVRSGSSFSSSEQLWPHFGLGDTYAEKVDVLVKWPSGLDETWKGVAVNQMKELTEGSAPVITAAPTSAPTRRIGSRSGKGKGKKGGKRR